MENQTQWYGYLQSNNWGNEGMEIIKIQGDPGQQLPSLPQRGMNEGELMSPNDLSAELEKGRCKELFCNKPLVSGLVLIA